MRTTQLVRHAHHLHCSLCGERLFTVRDTRFGQPPAAVVCRACTLRAFAETESIRSE